MTSTLRPRPRRLPTLVAATLLALLVMVIAFPLMTWGRLTAGNATDEGAGAWQWPLRPTPTVERGFEPPADPWGPGHRGVDLTGRVGQAVLAVDDGTVAFAGFVGGRGVVTVRHGPLRSTYQPVLPEVRAGQQVDVGDVLGRLTQVGSHCLPETCLHLGARRGRHYLDPLTLLGAVEIRLKPLQPLPSRGPDPASGPGPVRRLQSTLPTTEGLVSGARVGLTIGRPQPFRGDVRIDLGRGQ